MSNVIQWYEKLYETEVDRYAKLGYSSFASQEERLRSACEIMHREWFRVEKALISRFSVLDVGCGFGDLLRACEFWGIELTKYVGVDFMLEFVDEAEERFAEEISSGQAEFFRFSVEDLEKVFEPESFDFVVAIDLFTEKIDDIDNMWRMKECLLKMWKICKFGMIHTHLSSRKDIIRNREFAVDPAKLLTWCYDNFGWRQILSQGYAPMVFTIGSFKNQDTPWMQAWKREGYEIRP